MQDQKSNEVVKDRSPGFLYLLVLFISIVIMLAGLGLFTTGGESQLPEIYSTALTLCLSCIGLGEINFKFLGMISIIFVATMVVYFLVVKVMGGKNGRKN